MKEGSNGNVEHTKDSLLFSSLNLHAEESSSVLPHLNVELRGFESPDSFNTAKASGSNISVNETPLSVINSHTPDSILIRESPTLPPYPIPPVPEDILPHIALHLRTTILSLAELQYPPHVCLCEDCEPRILDLPPDITKPDLVLKALREYRWPGEKWLRHVQMVWISKRCPDFQSVELRHGPGRGIKFPSWCLHIWESLIPKWDNITSWRQTVNTLREEEDNDTLILMGTIRWPFRSPLRGIAPAEISSFATKVWLSDSHIDLLGSLLNDDLKGTSKHFLDWPIVLQLMKTYSEVKEGVTPSPSKSSKNVLHQLKTGTLTTVGCCFNVDLENGIPSKGRTGNHWVATVLDIPTQTIWYGDSLDHPPHQSVLEHLRLWMHTTFPMTFRVHILQHHLQPGDWMCGDYAINMIAHYLLPEKYPLVGPTHADAVGNRRLMFCRLLSLCGGASKIHA